MTDQHEKRLDLTSPQAVARWVRKAYPGFSDAKVKEWVASVIAAQKDDDD